MKKKLAAAIFALIACLTQQALAATTFGDADCGQWINNKTSPRKTWLLGYMSGLSLMFTITPLAKISSENPLGQINSAEQIFLWIDNYCQANPLKGVTDGGSALFFELANKK